MSACSTEILQGKSMSFCTQIKDELLNIQNIEPCCSLAEMYGLLLFSKAFSKREMFLSTENEKVAVKYMQVAGRLIGHEIDIVKSSSGKCRVSVLNESDRVKILEAFGLSGDEKSRRINWSNINNECCFGAFLRGVFLACGTLNNPEKSYHLEFSVPYSLKNDLIRILEEVDLQPKEIKRNNSFLLYFKDSEEILTLLTVIGANDAVLEYMGVKIYKDIRNNVNRRTNFENANFERTVNAAIAQQQAIEKLKKEGKFNTLPEELKEIAVLRLENPDMSLKEIGESLKPPLSRSGVNHRLQKIMSIAYN